MSKTKIEWSEFSWNPITGCTHAGSPGCDMCYARRMARRLAGRHGYPEQPHHFDVTLRPDRLDEPLRWRKPRMVFVCSMSDLFHEDVPTKYIAQIFGVMTAMHEHTFQVLTKRPKRMAQLFSLPDSSDFRIEMARARNSASGKARNYSPVHSLHSSIPLPNAWLGVSIENQTTADARREYLRQCPAAVRFVSYEPALGSIDWAGWEFVDQIISGGESGPGARPSHPNWHRATRDFCQEHSIAYFFKQWGAYAPWGIGCCDYMQPFNCDEMKHRHKSKVKQPYVMFRVGKKAAGRLLDGREHNEMPMIKGDET